MLVATDTTSKKEFRVKHIQLMEHLSPSVRALRIFGTCATHMAYLSEGKFDFYFKNCFDFWDFAAGVLIVQEAGGVATDFNGGEITIDSKNIVVSNGKVHNDILKFFKK